LIPRAWHVSAAAQSSGSGDLSGGGGVETMGQGVEGHDVVVIATFLGWARSRGDRDFPWKGTAWKGKVSW